MDTISHQPMNNNPTISEAAYFIQRVNRILQTQGGGGNSEPANNYGQQYNNTQGFSMAHNNQNMQGSQNYTSVSQMQQYN